MSFLEIGKVPNHLLDSLILSKIHSSRHDILLKPSIGEDCAAIGFGEYACVLTTDPITGADANTGRLAVHVSCNDIASCGVEPVGLMVTILAPNGTTAEQLEQVMKEICETAAMLNVDILGGHTEITSAVNRMVVSTTAIGKTLKDKLISTSGAQEGDDIILTKFAGLEGTAIIASDKANILGDVIDEETLKKAQRLIEHISVVREGVIAGQYGATAMHDVTEGGVLGAVWEIAEASEKGAEIDGDQIAVLPETEAICRHFGIDPFRLISSGCMLITCSYRDTEKLLKALKDAGIPSTRIGRITGGNKRILRMKGIETEILQPESDELYKV